MNTLEQLLHCASLLKSSPCTASVFMTLVSYPKAVAKWVNDGMTGDFSIVHF